MTSSHNKATAQAAYAAFSAGDAGGAMRDIDEAIVWTTRGHNALTGMRTGKAAVGELWGQLTRAGFRTEPSEFLADGNKVVVLTTIEMGGERDQSADVLTYNDQGKLIGFDAFGDPAMLDRAFAKSGRFTSASHTAR